MSRGLTYIHLAIIWSSMKWVAKSIGYWTMAAKEHHDSHRTSLRSSKEHHDSIVLLNVHRSFSTSQERNYGTFAVVDVIGNGICVHSRWFSVEGETGAEERTYRWWLYRTVSLWCQHRTVPQELCFALLSFLLEFSIISRLPVHHETHQLVHMAQMCSPQVALVFRYDKRDI